MTLNRLNTTVQYLLSGVIALVTVFAIFAQENSIATYLVEYNVHMMIGLMMLGFAALMLNAQKLMTVSLFCCMAFCLFLKNASNDLLVLPEVNKEPQVSIAHFNVSNIQDVPHLMKTIEETEVDFISFQELTPDWHVILQDSLKKKFPFNMSLVRVDPFGMAFYSKLKLSHMDTFLFEGRPNLEAKITVDNKHINLIGSYILPELTKATSIKTRNHLDLISFKIRNKESAVIALGDYNMVYWANPISRFRANAQLVHSRRDVSEGNLKPPYDHIFFSNDLECTKFENIDDLQQNHIGIFGTYQVKSENTPMYTPPTALSSLH